MSQPFRLPGGGRIDRSKPLSVTFNGKRLDDSIFDLTYTLVSRGFLGDAVCLTQISTRGFFNLCSQCLVNLGR